MKAFRATLRSMTPYSQGKHHQEEKLPRELNDAYERRTFRAKCHTAAGEVYIPPMAFKLLLQSTAAYLGEQIPGKGKETYTKHYRQGVICPEPVMLGIQIEDVEEHRLFTPAQPGSRTNKTRVWKSFTLIPEWAGELHITAVDDIFTAEVIRRHLDIGGRLVGIGVWRPENSGMWGKFQVTAFEEVPV
jgi:hypothetical protein